MIESTFYFKLMNCTDLNMRATNVVGFCPKKEYLPILFPGITPPYDFDATDDQGNVYHLQFKIAPVSGQAYIQNQMQQYINANCKLCDTISLEKRIINGSSPKYFLSKMHITSATVFEKDSSTYHCLRNDMPITFPFDRKMDLKGNLVRVQIAQTSITSTQEYTISIDGNPISLTHHKKDLFEYPFIVLDFDKNIIYAVSDRKQSIQRITQK